MSEYRLGAITVALTLARVAPVDIPFGAGLAGTLPIHAALYAIKAPPWPSDAHSRAAPLRPRLR
jgi:hypothetical protein